MRGPVAIIGAGPAGLACARRLVSADVPVVIIDDNPQAGGQYFRQLPPQFTVSRTARIERDQTRAEFLLGILAHRLVTYFRETCIWALSTQSTLAYAGPSGSGRIEAEAIVVAAGAHDRPLPFPGWTLPGVMTAGGCLNLIKGQGILPGRRFALVGNGPLLLVVAHSLLRLGAEVAVVAEAVPTIAGLRHWVGLLQSPKLLLKGLRYRAKILRSGTPFLGRHVVVNASGDTRVTEICVAPLGPDGIPDAVRSRSFMVDTVVAGYGLAPSNELTRLFGCSHSFDLARGGWIPDRSAELETSLPGIFAIGDCAGIGGVEIALAEADVAADALIRRFGRQVDFSRSRAKLRRLNHFRDALNAYYLPARPPWPATETTTLCRCEEITASEVCAAVSHCGASLPGIKALTRLSMGRCQGRNCLAAAATLLSALTGRSAGEFPLPRMRPPARLVPIAQLMEEPLGPPRTPDQLEGTVDSMAKEVE